MYEIFILKRAKKFIDKLPKNEKRRIVEAIEKLPFEGDIKTVQGFKGFFRLRVGDYRIIYTVDHGKLVICVTDADSRGQVYNRW